MDNEYCDFIAEEHKLHYDIYYNELNLFYQKNNFFSTIQLALLSGVVLKFEDLVEYPIVMLIGLVFLVLFTIIQLLVSIRGNHVNNAIIGAITTFEKKYEFDFLNNFSNELKKGRRIQKMNFPSYAIIITNLLYLTVWLGILLYFVVSHLPSNWIMISFNKIRNISTISCALKTFFVIVFSCLFAVTMKIADMLDEHGLYMFKGAKILFGILWGLFGSLIILFDVDTANAIFAMMLGYVVRHRLDQVNHIIAFTMIVLSFFMFSSTKNNMLLIFWVAFVVLGKVKDLKYIHNKNKIFNVIQNIYLYIPIIYAIPTFIYGLLCHNWYPFLSMWAFDFSYNLTRLISKRKNWYTEA